MNDAWSEKRRRMEEVYHNDIWAYMGFKYSRPGYWHADNFDDLHRAQEDGLKKLLDPLNIQPGDRVLDIGGGLGETAIWMAKRFHCKVVIVDIVENMIRRAREAIQEAGLEDRIEAICSDILEWGEPEESFDHVISAEALQHITDQEKLFRKIASLLRPGGTFAASIYLSEMKPGFLKKLYLKWTVGDKDLSPLSHYLNAMKNSGLDGSEVEDISDAVLTKSSQILQQGPYYSRITEYHRKYYGQIANWLTPWFFKWNESVLRKKQLRLVICRARKPES